MTFVEAAFARSPRDVLGAFLHVCLSHRKTVTPFLIPGSRRREF